MHPTTSSFSPIAAAAAAAAAAAEVPPLLASGASHPSSPLSLPRSPVHTWRDSPEDSWRDTPSPLHIPRGPPVIPRHASQPTMRLHPGAALGSREAAAPRTAGAAARAGTAAELSPRGLSPPRGWAAESAPPADSPTFGWAADDLSLGGSVAHGWADDSPSPPLTAIPTDVLHVDTSGPASGQLKVRIGSATAWQKPKASPTAVVPSAATATDGSKVATPGAASTLKERPRPRTKDGSSRPRRTRKPARAAGGPFLAVGL